MADQATQGLLSPLLQRARLSAALPHIHGDVLDFGCGNGALANFLPPDNYYGFDSARDVIETARTLHPLHAFSCTLPEDRKFDTVVALAVIEHLKDPLSGLRQWTNALRTGGRIVLTTPNKRHLWIHELGALTHLFSRDAAEEHHSAFNMSGLERLASVASLKIATKRYFLMGANQLAVLDLC